MNDTVDFILADNQDITRAGIQYYLSSITVNTVEAADKAALLNLLTAHPEAAVVLDYTLFNFQGIEDLLVVVGRFPDAHWLLFSEDLSEDFIRRVCMEPQVSVMLKTNSGDEIRTALQCVARGERFLCHQVGGCALGAHAFRGGDSAHDCPWHECEGDCTGTRVEHPHHRDAQKEYLPQVGGEQCV
jgi:DNA-binding NarL/FixJ family response regulator